MGINGDAAKGPRKHPVLDSRTRFLLYKLHSCCLSRQLHRLQVHDIKMDRQTFLSSTCVHVCGCVCVCLGEPEAEVLASLRLILLRMRERDSRGKEGSKRRRRRIYTRIIS